MAMHGLINRSIQCFLRDTYGAQVWSDVAIAARLGFDSFEAMLSYESDLTEAVLTAACTHLDKRRDVLLEDLGTYLVSHPNVEALRRLLRFGGTTFEGGRGGIGGTVAGVFVLVIAFNLVNIVGLNFNAQLIVKGAIIIAASAAYVYVKRRQ